MRNIRDSLYQQKDLVAILEYFFKYFLNKCKQISFIGNVPKIINFYFNVLGYPLLMWE